MADVERIGKLINDLQKPTFVYTMARTQKDSPNPHMRKSAKSRMENASTEIENILQEYYEE